MAHICQAAGQMFIHHGVPGVQKARRRNPNQRTCLRAEGVIEGPLRAATLHVVTYFLRCHIRSPITTLSSVRPKDFNLNEFHRTSSVPPSSTPTARRRKLHGTPPTGVWRGMGRGAAALGTLRAASGGPSGPVGFH